MEQPTSPNGQPPYRVSAVSLWADQNMPLGLRMPGTNFANDGRSAMEVEHAALGGNDSHVPQSHPRSDEPNSAAYGTKAAGDSGWLAGGVARDPSPSLAEHTMNAAAQGNKAKFKEMLEKRRAAVRNTNSAKRQDDDGGKISEQNATMKSTTIITAATTSTQANTAWSSQAVSDENRTVSDTQTKVSLTPSVDINREHSKKSNATNGIIEAINGGDVGRNVLWQATSLSTHSHSDVDPTKANYNQGESNGQASNSSRNDDLIYKQMHSANSHLDTRGGSTDSMGNQRGTSNALISTTGTSQSRPAEIRESMHGNISPPVAPPRRQPRLENSMNILRVNYFLTQREKRSTLVSQKYEKAAGEAVRAQSRIRELQDQLQAEKRKLQNLDDEKMNLQSKLGPMRHAINQRRVVLSSLYSHNHGVKGKIMDEFNEMLKKNGGKIDITDNDDLSFRAREDNTNEYCFSFNFKNKCLHAGRGRACPNVHACMHCQQAHPVVLCPSVEGLCKAGDIPKPTVHFDTADAHQASSPKDMELADVDLDQDFEDEWIPERERETRTKSDIASHAPSKSNAELPPRLPDRDRHTPAPVIERKTSTSSVSGYSQNSGKGEPRPESYPQSHYGQHRHHGEPPRDHLDSPKEHQPPRDYHHESSKEQYDQSKEKSNEYNKRDNRPCWNWNRSRCKSLKCQFRHICSICSGDHRFTHCPRRVGADPSDGPLLLGEHDHGVEDRDLEDPRRPSTDSTLPHRSGYVDNSRAKMDDDWSADEIIRRVDSSVPVTMSPRPEFPHHQRDIPRQNVGREWSTDKIHDQEDMSVGHLNWVEQQQISLHASQSSRGQPLDQPSRPISPEEERLRQLREAALSSLRGMIVPASKPGETASDKIFVKQESIEPDISNLRSEPPILHPIPQRPASHQAPLSSMGPIATITSSAQRAPMPLILQSYAPPPPNQAIPPLPVRQDISLAREPSPGISSHMPQQLPQVQNYAFQQQLTLPMSPRRAEQPPAHGYGPSSHPPSTSFQSSLLPTQPRREYSSPPRGPLVRPLTPKRDSFNAPPREPLYERERERAWERERERERSVVRYLADENPNYDQYRDDRSMRNMSPQYDEFRRAPEYDDYRPASVAEHYPPPQRLSTGLTPKDPYYPSPYHQNPVGVINSNKDYYGGDKNFGPGGYDDLAARKRKYDPVYQTEPPYDSRSTPAAVQAHPYMRSPTPSRSGIASYGGSGLSYGPLGGGGGGRDPRDGRDKRYRWS